MNDVAVICLGNRYLAGDDLGCRAFDQLAGTLAGIDVVDGGLCGLDLLMLLEGRRRVIFVDAVAGLAAAGEIVVLGGDQVAAHAGRYGHSAGLPYLLRMLPHACAAPLPEVVLVGAEGCCADEAVVQALTRRCQEVARHGP